MSTFNEAEFCEALYKAAAKIAEERLGAPPKSHQFEMFDLLKAFGSLRKDQYAAHFGHESHEWNEAAALTRAYISAIDSRAVPPFSPDIATALGHAIMSWPHFSTLPHETQQEMHKVTSAMNNVPARLSERLTHFFNEVKLRVGALSEAEKEVLTGLVNLYKPQAQQACQKQDIPHLEHICEQLSIELHRLNQSSSSRALQNLCIKTQHDIATFQSFLKGTHNPKNAH
jgi:hypothetical protein